MSSRRLCECILFLCLFFLSFRHFDDADGWWHLKTGEQIFETGSIPHQDIYSATRAGQEWITHEWLTQLSMFLLHRVGGFTLVTIVFALIATLAFWIVYLRCPVRPFIAAIPLVLGVAAASPMLGARPQVVSILMASIFIAVQERYAQRHDRGYLALLVGLMLVWVNAHGAFILGPILIVLQLGGLALDRATGQTDNRSWTHFRDLSIALAGCIAIVAINPNGLSLFGYVVKTVRRTTEQAYLADWASPNFHLLPSQLFAALILGFLAALALSRERVPASDVLTFVAFAYLGMNSVRHIPIFAVVAVPIVVRQLSYTLGRLSLSRDVRSDREFRSLNGVLVAAALFLMVCRIVSFVGTERTAEAEKFPRAAVDFIRDNRPDGPIFNLYEWGGYLIWNLHPQWKVYVDGRPEIYGDAYIQEYIDAYYGRRSWQKLLQRTDIQTVLVEPIAPLASLLRESPDWQNAFEDQVAVVFIHRDATGSALNRSK